MLLYKYGTVPSLPRGPCLCCNLSLGNRLRLRADAVRSKMVPQAKSPFLPVVLEPHSETGSQSLYLDKEDCMAIYPAVLVTGCVLCFRNSCDTLLYVSVETLFKNPGRRTCCGGLNFFINAKVGL